MIVLFFVISTLVIPTLCREVGLCPNGIERKLLLSRRVITESGEINGGVLVNDRGIIEDILTWDQIEILLRGDYEITVFDGGDLALIAGVVDSHVHVNEPGRTSWEGFVTATQAAAAGGITTLIDMPLNSIPPTTTLENLKIKAAAAKEEVYIDVGFWGGVIPGNEGALLSMIDAGVRGFKAYLIDSGVDEFPMIDVEDLQKAFTVLNGTGTAILFHAELSVSNATSTNTTESTDGCSSSPDPILFSTYLASRPPEMELAAVALIAEYLPETDVHVHIVHVSAAGVVPILEEARQARILAGYKGWRGGVTAETCPHYLTLSADQVPPGHTEYKCSPPIRDINNKMKLWEYIQNERLDLIASDHSPSTPDLKTPSFMDAWGGIASVQFGLPLFWTEASARGYNLSTVSHYLSSGPAHLAGLQDKKGAIKVGLDADLVFFDPNAAFIVTPDVIRYKNKLSPYMNRVLRGKVIHTYLRGQLIYSDDKLVGQPKGLLILNESLWENQRL